LRVEGLGTAVKGGDERTPRFLSYCTEPSSAGWHLVCAVCDRILGVFMESYITTAPSLFEPPLRSWNGSDVQHCFHG
jgi:hypothetical protein